MRVLVSWTVYLPFQNVAANHRANDVIVREGARQVLVARFMYGPLDMITLAGWLKSLITLCVVM
jgi:hypothetical protein